MKFYLGNIETRWTKSAARGLRSSGDVDQKCFKYSFESLFRAKGNLSFCLVSEGRSSESEDQSPERPAKLRCGRLRSAPRLGGGGPDWGAGLPTTPPTGVPAHSRGFLLPQPALWVQTDQGRAEPSGGWWGPGSALRPSSQGPEAQLPSSVLRRVATPGASPWSGPQSLPGMQRAGVASRCRWPRCSPGLTGTPPPPPPAVQTLRLCSHLGPSPQCGWSRFSQPGRDLGPADQPRGTSGRRGVPPPDRPGARVWSWPLSAPSSLQASGLLQPFAACAWPSAVLFFLEVVSGRLSDHPVALSFAAARLPGLQGEAAASGPPEAPRRPAGTGP